MPRVPTAAELASLLRRPAPRVGAGGPTGTTGPRPPATAGTGTTGSRPPRTGFFLYYEGVWHNVTSYIERGSYFPEQTVYEFRNGQNLGPYTANIPELV